MNIVHPIYTLLLTIVIGLVIATPIINYLRGLKASQTEREELVSHKKKEGTPTMGGLIFIISATVVYFIYFKDTKGDLPILLVSLGFGAIGFIDDFLKVVLKRSDGLIAWQKFLLQFVVCLVFIIYLYRFSGEEILFNIPYIYGLELNLGYFAIPLLFLAIVGTVNGVNFTDGLDGLASTVTLVVSIFFVFSNYILTGTIQYFPIIMAGALLAFLVFNVYPAKTFMGDTGSLFLGGYVASCAVLQGLTIFIIIFGFIYLAEVLSVIIQVTYFKKTGGKRVFRMAPIHHHYELGGMSETRIVVVFSMVTLILCIISLLGM